MTIPMFTVHGYFGFISPPVFRCFCLRLSAAVATADACGVADRSGPKRRDMGGEAGWWWWEAGWWWWWWVTIHRYILGYVLSMEFCSVLSQAQLAWRNLANLIWALGDIALRQEPWLVAVGQEAGKKWSDVHPTSIHLTGGVLFWRVWSILCWDLQISR